MKKMIDQIITGLITKTRMIRTKKTGRKSAGLFYLLKFYTVGNLIIFSRFFKVSFQSVSIA